MDSKKCSCACAKQVEELRKQLEDVLLRLTRTETRVAAMLSQETAALVNGNAAGAAAAIAQISDEEVARRMQEEEQHAHANRMQQYERDRLAAEKLQKLENRQADERKTLALLQAERDPKALLTDMQQRQLRGEKLTLEEYNVLMLNGKPHPTTCNVSNCTLSSGL